VVGGPLDDSGGASIGSSGGEIEGGGEIGGEGDFEGEGDVEGEVEGRAGLDRPYPALTTATPSFHT
jgi:hypothetical protein